jgi:hypothetical protein
MQKAFLFYRVEKRLVLWYNPSIKVKGGTVK